MARRDRRDGDEADAVGLEFSIDATGIVLRVEEQDRPRSVDLPSLAAGAAIRDLIHPQERDFFDMTRRWVLGEPGRQAQIGLRLQQTGDDFACVRARLTGDPAGVITVALGVGEKTGAHAAQEQLLRVLENAPQGVLVRTAEGQILYVNPALPAMMGYAREELLATGNISRHLHPDDRPLVNARAIARAANQDVPAQYEFRFLHRDGSTLWIDCLAAHAVWNGVPVSLSWLTNITARKRVEEALRRSERLFVKIFQESPDILTLTTVADGRYVDVNETFLKLSGRPRSEVIGRSSLELGIWSDPGVRSRLMEKLQRDGTVREVVAFDFGVDGEARDYSVSGEIVQFEGQDLLLMVSHDITEQRRQEERRWRSQKLEALGTLAGGIAHDLNNTLVPVLSLTKITAKRLPEGSRERQNLMIVLKASERARDLVKQILAFSRKEECQEKTVLDPVAMLDEAMDMLRASLPATIGIDLRVEPVPRLLGDAGQLQQVIINLVTNAAQAIGAAMGTVTIGLGTASPKPGVAPSHGRDWHEWICLSVADTGCGMDEATLRRAFEPFFTTKAVGEGTGLGLSVVHGIVNAHGGQVDVTSTAGKGTKFTLYFPALSEADASLPAHTAIPSSWSLP
jgi:PAS domain S-box-containing protein